MGRTPKFPIVLDDLMMLSIAKFKIKAGTYTECTLSYRSIEFQCSIVARDRGGIFRLKTTNGKPWIINLQAVQSNLGKSSYFLFECPVTQKTCRKLYFYEGKFQHQSVIPVNYEQQNRAKHYRGLERLFRHELGTVGNEMLKPYFKSHYRGQPTKRFLRIMKKIKEEEQFYKANVHQFLQEMINKNK